MASVHTRAAQRSGAPSQLSPSGAAPLHEALQRVELGQAQAVVDLGRVPVAVLSPLPELAPVGVAGEHRLVLLRLVTEDGDLLPLDVVGTERHDALDLVRLPLLPGAAVLPDLGALAFLPHFAHGLKNGVGAH